MKNKKIGLVIGGVIVLVAVFYGGIVYGKSQNKILRQGSENFMANALNGGTGFARNNRVAGGLGASFTNGEIISKDDKSITVKLNGATPQDGQGSKIIFLDSNTKILKSTDGSLSDLSMGTQVSVTGAANTDGSLNAQSIQIRPKTVVK